MLDDAMFDPATYAPNGIPPGLLAQMFAGPGGPAPAPGLPAPVSVGYPPGGAPPSGKFSSGDGGALMPVPMPPPSAQAELPPNAAPTAGGPVPPTSALGRVASSEPDSFLGNFGEGIKKLLQKGHEWAGDNRSTLMALGAGMAGSQSIGQGLSRGMQMAIPAQQADIAQQKVNQTAKWLVSKGMSPQEANAVVNNPDMMKQLLPRIMGAKQLKWTQTGEDMLGNKQYGFVDEASGKRYDDTGREIGPGKPGESGGTSIPRGPDGAPIQGDALMQHLEKTDPVTAAGIKGLISGDISAAGRNMQKLAPLAKLVDPTFDATQYPVRLGVRKSYTSGKDFQESQALNTVSGHLGRLMESADALGNTSYPWVNKIGNVIKENTVGSPALVKFRNDLVTTQNELAKAYHGGHVSDSAFAAFNKSINEAQTPAEMKAAIGELSGLLSSKIEAKESGYRSSMGPTPLPEEYRATNQHAREAFAKINDWAAGVPKAASATTGGGGAAATPAPKVVLPAGNYHWTPNGGVAVAP